MLNLLVALVATSAVFLVGTFVAGHWIAGFAPAVIVLVVTYYLLARRTSSRLQAIMEAAGKAAQRQKLDEARKILESARPLGRWQFLVEAQVEAQLGALDYILRDFAAARPHLQKAFSRNWMAQGMLAAIDFRDGNIDAAAKRLEKANLFARKEALYWGLYAYIYAEGKRQDEALVILGRALKLLPQNEALKGMQQAVSNRKKLRMKDFGDTWYTFFPEQFPMRRAAQQAMQGRGYPMPRR
jgi:tetratricopeptide (TPR) repeat protein